MCIRDRYLVLLPILQENINSPAMVCHAINIIVTLLKNINSEQIPVITSDQPVYALAKQLQWRYPELYGEDKMFLMLGGLHINLAIISMIGSWLEGSAWIENLVESSVTTPGRAEGLLKSSHVKRSRYAHEVSYASLNIFCSKHTTAVKIDHQKESLSGVTECNKNLFSSSTG